MFRYDTFLSREVGVGDSYPYLLAIGNPGFESGVASPWGLSDSNVSGGFVSSPHSGSYCARAGTSRTPRWWQDIDIPSGLEADIDAGRLEIELSWWQSGYSSDSDRGTAFVWFLDASDVILVKRQELLITRNSNSWLERSIVQRVPEGARKVRVGTRNARADGTNLDVYYDDFSSIEFRIAAKEHTTLLVMNPAVLQLTGWTNVVGTLIYHANATEDLAQPGYYWNNASAECYRSMSIPSGMETDVDAGLMTLGYNALNCGYSADSDRGRVFIEFRDGSDTLLGSREYNEASDTDNDYAGVPYNREYVIPANTRTVRTGYTGTRATGTQLSWLPEFNWIYIRET